MMSCRTPCDESRPVTDRHVLVFVADWIRYWDEPAQRKLMSMNPKSVWLRESSKSNDRYKTELDSTCTTVFILR